MSKLLLVDAIDYVEDRSLAGVELLRVPTARSFGVNNARANRREIFQIARFWEANGLGEISTAEQSELYFNFNDKARRLAGDYKKKMDRVSLSDFLASDKFQKIGNLSISFLSFVVSIGALIVAVIAMSKAS